MQTIRTESRSEKATSAPIDMLQAYIGTALDVIGRAGFNYNFNSHSSTSNPLADAFNHMVNANLESKTIAMIQQVFPGALNWVSCQRVRRALTWKPTKSRAAVVESRKILDNIGKVCSCNELL